MGIEFKIVSTTTGKQVAITYKLGDMGELVSPDEIRKVGNFALYQLRLARKRGLNPAEFRVIARCGSGTDRRTMRLVGSNRKRLDQYCKTISQARLIY